MQILGENKRCSPVSFRNIAVLFRPTLEDWPEVTVDFDKAYHKRIIQQSSAAVLQNVCEVNPHFLKN